MKKFFCYAFACIGVLAATAQPATSLMKDMQGPKRIISGVKPQSAKKQAPSKALGNEAWGEWEMVGTGTFNIDDGLALFLGLEEWQGDFKGINVYSRSNAEEETAMQYKFEGVYNDADIIVDYDANTGLCKVMPQPTNIDAYGMALDVADCGTIFELYGEEWSGLSPEEAQEIADMYASYNYFVPELGRFYIYLGYLTDGLQDIIALTDCTLQLDGIDDMTVSVEANDFYKDATDMQALIKFPAGVECRYGCFEGMLTQAKINSILDNAEGVKSLTETASVDLDCSEGIGLYTIIAVTFADNGTPLEWDYAEYTYTPSSSEGWTALGKGSYTSDMFESLLEMEAPTYDVEVERNDANPALIRIVNPYGKVYPYAEDENTVTAEGFDIYVVFDTTNPDRVFFKTTNLGIDFGGGWWMSANDGYFTEVIEGKTASADSFGKLEDDVITFPKKSVLTTCENISVLGGENGNWYFGNSYGVMSLTLPKVNSAEVIATDNNETEYFNMQGMKVTTPEKGEMVIERRGASATKKIIR